MMKIIILMTALLLAGGCSIIVTDGEVINSQGLHVPERVN